MAHRATLLQARLSDAKQGLSATTLNDHATKSQLRVSSDTCADTPATPGVETVSERQADAEVRTVRVRGQLRPYLERRRICGRDYYLLERIGSPERLRYHAFSHRPGVGGQEFVVQLWPHDERLRRQLSLWKRLKDDSLPRLVDAERQADAFVVVLTWTEGLPLSEYFTHLREGRRPAVDPGQALRLLQGLANGVCRLHQSRQIAHGDIQPANLVLTSGPSRLALIDFGSGWITHTGNRTVDGDGFHPIYGAPELRTTDQPVGFFADQFSTAVVGYQLLTGRLPYDGLGGKAGWPQYSDARDTLLPPSRVSEACRRLPGSLRDRVDEIFLRSLALEPTARYADRSNWLSALFECSAQFRLTPELSAGARTLTRVIDWFVRRAERRR